jgi:hypothetical protein
MVDHESRFLWHQLLWNGGLLGCHAEATPFDLRDFLRVCLQHVSGC